MILRILGMAGLMLAVMILATAWLGPGVGVEANCVSLQTCGKTMIGFGRDLATAVRWAWGNWPVGGIAATHA